MKPYLPKFLASAVAVAVFVPASVLAFDLTGTWVGKWTCKGSDGGKFVGNNADSVLLVTQIGETIAMSMDGGSYVYNGGAVPDATRPDEKGEMAAISCDTDLLPLVGGEGEMIRAKVKTGADGSGSLKGKSIIEGSGPGFVGSCKYVYTRTSSVNPAVSGCLN